MGDLVASVGITKPIVLFPTPPLPATDKLEWLPGVAEHAVVATILRLSWEATERKLILSQRPNYHGRYRGRRKFLGFHQPLCNLWLVMT